MVRKEDLYREYMGSLLAKCSERTTAKVLGDLFTTSFLTYDRFMELVYREDIDPKCKAFLNGVNAAINTITDNTNEAIEREPAMAQDYISAAGEAITQLSDFSDEILSSATESSVEAIKGAVSLIIANEKMRFDEEKQEKIDNIGLLDEESDEPDEDDESEGEDDKQKDKDEEDTEDVENSEESSEEGSGDAEDTEDESQEAEVESTTNPFDDEPSTAKESAGYGRLALYTEDNRYVALDRPVEYIGMRVKDMMISSEDMKTQLESADMETAVNMAKTISDAMIEGIIICAAFCADMKIPTPHLSNVLDSIGRVNEVSQY